jgi:hypothetical protein
MTNQYRRAIVVLRVGAPDGLVKDVLQALLRKCGALKVPVPSSKHLSINTTPLPIIRTELRLSPSVAAFLVDKLWAPFASLEDLGLSSGRRASRVWFPQGLWGYSAHGGRFQGTTALSQKSR